MSDHRSVEVLLGLVKRLVKVVRATSVEAKVYARPRMAFKSNSIKRDVEKAMLRRNALEHIPFITAFLQVLDCLASLSNVILAQVYWLRLQALV